MHRSGPSRSMQIGLWPGQRARRDLPAVPAMQAMDCAAAAVDRPNVAPPGQQRAGGADRQRRAQGLHVPSAGVVRPVVEAECPCACPLSPRGREGRERGAARPWRAKLERGCARHLHRFDLLLLLVPAAAAAAASAGLAGSQHHLAPAAQVAAADGEKRAGNALPRGDPP
jgi:hypothetical protein